MAGSLPVVHARESAFSYRCRACNRCCYGKRIQVNPYELVRLARGLGTTTTDVIGRFTVDNGTALATRDDSSCVFLGSGGCTVHADRPLACRLYPLGRIVKADGSEIFVENEPHPETEGIYGDDGTVGDFITAQGVAPYLAAADRYYAVFTRLVVSRDDAGTDDIARGPRESALGQPLVPALGARGFIDADLAVQDDAARGGAPVPSGIESLVERHLALIGHWAERMRSEINGV
jgi:Fe-S-cluster containining protein